MAQVSDEIVPMPQPLAPIPPIDGLMRKRIRPLVRKQPKPSNVQYELLCRMCAVLKFYYERSKSKKDPLATIQEFGGAILGGAELTGLII